MLNRLDRTKYTQEEITKDLIQSVALEFWKQNDFYGSCYMATGTGKSRVAILAAQFIAKQLGDSVNILLVVPTEKLRDENWKNEFERWDNTGLWNNLQRTCYASLNKLKNQIWDLVILDEEHRTTTLNSEFFDQNNNEILSVIGLTATPPEDKDKKELLSQIAPPVFLYTLEEAEGDGLVAPFDFWIIKTKLNRVTKNIKAGNIKKRWFQTEFQKYTYLCDQIEKLRFEKLDKLSDIPIDIWKVRGIADGGLGYTKTEISLSKEFIKIESSFDARIRKHVNERMHFINSLPSKTELAKRVLEKVHTGKGKRTIAFGGSIKQINEICGDNVYHSKSDTKKDLKAGNTAFDKFSRLEIDILGAIRSLNEGVSLELLDQCLIIQLNSKELDLIQRIGRIIRFRFGHRGLIIIIVCEDTVDWKWFKSAMRSFSKEKLKYFDASMFD